ncbi:FGGY-family carbohydrate kinase [Homoserinibacter sp. YIM 151385]|uniref:FGGY-family carbohydrate kinase n=1 Tax=Homoserinibacter sp. YIM 151385 TaxID=2985506 RepID=UPI0022F0C89D|nr:FGGY-family carbohydrate kinase [Homoserinibacter sp. YIM 151385]WBU39262.1 FGGY-family carbohydrate kinase [Homoserinibacter sp. YIM 151385]
MTYFLSIDIGTESARAAVYTDAGVRVGDGVASYPTAFPRPGWAEQDPLQWWASAAEASRQALAEAGTSAVAGIGVATTSSSVAVLDEHGRPLRPALLWMDARAAAQSRRTAEVDHPALRYAGGSDSSEWLVPKAMWLAEHERDLYDRAAHIVEAVDYLTFRLTGEWVGSRLNATCKWNLDSRDGGLPAELYAALGVPELADKLPADIREVGAPAARITDEAAAKLGLVNRPVVGVGGIDAHLSLVALAGHSANPVSIVAGTSNAFIAELEEPVFSPTIWGPYPRALSERWLVEGGQVSAGSALTWLAERVLGFGRERIQALIADAGAIAPGSHGLLALDNLMGNRTPLRDPELRGAVLGLSLATTPAELYRASVESVAFGTRQVLDSFADAGVDTSDVYLTGGIRHNSLWLQTTADVLGRPVHLVDGENLTLMACAAIGMSASGETGSLAAAAERLRPAARRVEPDPAYRAVLEESYALYREATTVTTALHHRLAARSGAVHS